MYSNKYIVTSRNEYFVYTFFYIYLLRLAYHLLVEVVLGVKAKHSATVWFDARFQLPARHYEPSTQL